MAIKAQFKEVAQELTRELLIAISYYTPDKALNSDQATGNVNNIDGVAAIIADLTEKYRSELISISYTHPRNINM